MKNSEKQYQNSIATEDEVALVDNPFASVKQLVKVFNRQADREERIRTDAMTKEDISQGFSRESFPHVLEFQFGVPEKHINQ